MENIQIKIVINIYLFVRAYPVYYYELSELNERDIIRTLSS